jgi:peptidyl-prolyl cis-trans isomerase SurA
MKSIHIQGIGLFTIFFLVFISGSSAQNLFSYGKNVVTKDEFLKAYNKNNNDSTTHISYDDYLELYSRFKIKVQAALDAGMDTLPEQKAELAAFRAQLAESYLKEDESIRLFVDEAFERSLKDIHLSHIFLPVPEGADTAAIKAAEEKIKAVHTQLLQGVPFDEAAAPYEHGGLGYTTVFVLPYKYESIAYSLPKGSVSAPFRTGSGFHILRNNNERKAIGKVSIAQILLAYPPGADALKKKELAIRADSIYTALQGGASFGDLALKYSNDNLSYQNKGEMPVFGVGQFDTTFEKMAFSLEKDGDISRPFTSTFGYHIITRLQRIPVIEDKANKSWMEFLKERVMQSDRMDVANAMLARNIRKTIQKEASPKDLQSDSATLDYYRNHLEDYNQEFAEQIKEFREGNLLFGIMQKKVWDAATADSTALRNYYNANRSKYSWENSADAFIVTCTDPNAVEEVQSTLKNKPAEWRQLAEQSNGLIQADSGRFELSQIPVAERTNFTNGLVTAPVTNEQDSSKTFAYIIKLYSGHEPKSFEDAKGSVINDYQTYLEEKWIAGLKKKYPVKVNKKVFNTLPKTI